MMMSDHNNNDDDDGGGGAVFRVLSDLHLEMYSSPAALLATVPFEPDRDARSFLLLAGDVGYPFPGADGDAYRALLAALAARFRGVFVVAGNHEYYECARRGAQMADAEAAARAACAALHRPSRPVVFLQKEEWTIFVERGAGRAPHATRLFGCTLWTPVTAADARCMNDSARIGVAAPWIRAVHAEHAAWLRGRLSASEAAAAAAAAAAARNDDDDDEEEDVRVVDMEVDPTATADGAAPPPETSRVTVVRLDGSVEAGAPELARQPAQSRVVLTHHLPSCCPADADVARPLSGYYADMFRPSRGWPADAYPDLWVGGHDHAQARGWLAPGCALVTCCHGYPESAQGVDDVNGFFGGSARTKALFAAVMRRLQPPAARHVVTAAGQPRRAVYTDSLVELLPPPPPPPSSPL